jgi:methionyl aminopeptidase
MSIQSEADWAGLRAAAAVARRTLERVVRAVRPGVTTGALDLIAARDGWTLRTRDGSLAAHSEDALVITRGRPIVLTPAA